MARTTTIIAFLFLMLVLLTACEDDAQNIATTNPQPAKASTIPITSTASITSQHIPEPKIQASETTSTTAIPATTMPGTVMPGTTAGSQPMKITIGQGAKEIETLPEPTVAHESTLRFEDGEVFNIDPLQENIIEKQERNQEQEQMQIQEKKLHPWVAEEFEKFSEADEIQTHQIFSFEVQDQAEFKWNPTEFKSGPLKFVVEVFSQSRGDITFPENPQQDDFIEILTQSQSSNSYTNLGRVYLKKMLVINFFSDYQIVKVKNHYGTKMLVQISLQATKFVPEKALDDDTLKIPAEKIRGILEQLEQTQMKRQKTYKLQWSFRDRQQHHQSEMLILTGVELVVILGTAIVQMYCIKNLFDNRLIV